jgi:LuxR family maltose regulon positive regulatory protein
MADQNVPVASTPPERAAASLSPSQQAVQLLATKLFIPRPRPNAISRPDLLARVDRGLRGPLTVLAAPAGWGKTTVLSSWWAEVEAADAWRMAWVSLDAGDNDPVRFWTYVLTALDSVHPGLGEDALALLRAPQPPPIESVVTLLLNALATTSRDVILVLDDFHVIEAPQVHAALNFMLDHAPSQLHVVLATREDPPLPLARLRAQGGVTELRAADLRFTPVEAAQFLGAAVGAPVSPQALLALETRNEGWIAGLQLAVLSLQGRSREQAEAFLAAFAGSNRYIADYLVEEVLACQPKAIQAFLLRTAVVDRFCAPLCDRLLAADDTTAEGTRGGLPASVEPATQFTTPLRPVAQSLLEQVERANLFLIPLDDERQWYRYHHLFAGVLRSRLQELDPALPAELHRRASVWFEEQGLVEEAVEYALAAADFEHAATLIEDHAFLVALSLSRFETALRWLARLPEAVAMAHPLLKVQHAVLLTYTYEPDAAEARLREAEAGIARGAATPSANDFGAGDALTDPARTILGYIALIRGSVVSVTGDVARALTFARQSSDLIPESDSPWRAGAVIALANGYQVSGEVTAATDRQVAAAMAAARTVADYTLLTMSILSIQGHIQLVQGRLRQALASFQQVPPLAVPPLTLANLPGSQSYEVGLGDLFREWNDFAAAEEHLRKGVDELDGRILLPADVLALGYLAMARLQWARGAQATALETLDTFAELARRRGFASELVEREAAVRAQLAIAAGDVTAAARWADASGLSSNEADLSFRRELAYLALARVCIAQGRSTQGGPLLGEAERLLDRLLADAKAKGRGHTVVEVLLLRALALEVRRDIRGALRTLTRALELAQPEGYVRLFADEGTPMAVLLVHLLEATEERRLAVGPAVLEYARHLLAACRSLDGATPIPQMEPLVSAKSAPLTASVSPLIDPLTDREVEVLRLLAEGATNSMIAAALVVSVGTVKKHIFNVCRKLGAQNRTQAVARARALHLL